MLFYLTIFASLILVRIALGEYSPSNRRLYQFSAFLLFAFCILRFEVGCDWDGYYLHYIDQKEGTFETAFQKREWLWFAFLEVIDRLGLDYVWVNIVTSAIFFIGVHVFSKRQPDPFGFLILLFPILIINLPMSGIRQAAAVGFMCIALSAFIERRLFAFLIWTIIAGSIHSSAILFLFLAPFCLNLRPSVQLLAAAVLAMPGIWFVYSGQAAEVAFTRYVQADMDPAGAIYRIALIFVTGLLFMSVLRRSWSQLFPREFPLMEIGAVIMLVSGGVFFFSPVIADRFGYYMIPLQAAMLARLPYLPMRVGGPLFFLAPYVLFFAIFFGWMWLSGLFTACYVPYKIWLFG